MSSHAALRHQGARRASPDQIQHVPRNSTQGVDFVPQNVAAGSPPGVQPTSVSYSYSSSYPSQSAPRHSNATAPGWPHAGSVAAMSSAAGRMQPVLYSSPANAPSSFGIPATNHDPNHPGQHTYHHLPQRPASESAVHPNSTASHHAQTPQASTGYAHAPQRPASGPMTPPTPAAPRHAPTSQTPPQTSFNVEEHVRHLVAKLLAPTQNNFQQIWRALFDNVDAEFQRTYRQLLEEQMKAVQASRAAAALYERNKTLEEQVRGLTQYNRALHEQVDRQATELAKAKTDYELTREMARKLASENTMLARVYGKMLAGQTQTPAFAEASSSSAPVPSPQPQGSATQRTMASVNLGDLPPDLMESIRQERIRHSEKLEISLARSTSCVVN
ncbi:hypothetical protein OE88DRAFT_1239214 [Heliocybe sulcata]|uniref:Uncharacterized protein n=1 Tax=Heliocybe sulcata TaxID=5364 RepID=A0A5C3N7G8_9AGAM|nr:hypothetical protein OE88DRAFT_1239214 [Heliocybe sulcata]